MAEMLKYCEIAIKSIVQIIQNDFIFQFVLFHVENSKNLYYIVIKNIMEQTAKDINILNKFVKQNLQLILNGG